MQDTFQWPGEIRFWKRFSKEFSLAFRSALVIGFITHLYAMTNVLLSHDAVIATFDKNSHLESGRWALSAFSIFSSVEEMPIVISCISLFMLALTAALTVRTLRISSPVCIVLASGLIVAFPTVAATFGYMYTADAYFIALFFNALAVYLVKDSQMKWRGVFASALLLSVSLGIYQSYLGYALGLFLLACILDLLEGCPLKEVFRRGGNYLLVCGLGLSAYLAVEMSLLAVKGTRLLTYQGMDSIGRADFAARLSSVPNAYRIFVEFFFGSARTFLTLGNYGTLDILASALLTLIACVGLALGLASGLFLIIRRKICRDVPRVTALFIAYLLIPAALNCITIFAYSAQQYILMQYAFVLLPVWILKTCELSLQDMILSRVRLWKAACCVVCAAFCVIFWKYFLISNAQYHSLQINYENSFALANRIVARIEEMEEYDGQRIAFLGKTSGEQYGNEDRYKLYGAYIKNFPPLVNVYSYASFLSYYIGSHMESVSAERAAELQTLPEVLSMPVWPARESVALVDGVIVVKLGEIDPS